MASTTAGKRQGTDRDPETFTFFFRSGSPFSQWHSKKFTATTPFTGHETYNFCNCEQYMMFNKAVLFQDFEMAQKILETTDPKTVKSFGRQVKNFDDKVWKKYRDEIVYEGNKHKFSQNKDILQVLLDTKGTTLVEASPYDRIWGIGLAATDPRAKSRATWKGLNLLGEALTRLRNDLLAQQQTTT